MKSDCCKATLSRVTVYTDKPWSKQDFRTGATEYYIHVCSKCHKPCQPRPIKESQDD